MIELLLRNKKTKIPEADYILDKSEKFLDLVDVLTPKFEGVWKIVLIDPKLLFVKNLIEADSLPEYVNCIIMLPKPKMDSILMDFPKMSPKEKSPKDALKEMVINLHHLIDEKAMWMVYDVAEKDVNTMKEMLTKLDNECEGLTITTKQVQQSYVYTKRVYASEVLAAFLRKDRYRWNKLNTLTKELGDEIAYYALYKQVKTLLLDKNKYLHNEDTKSRIVDKIDAPLICYAYVLFANSSSWKNLHGIMYSLDNRCKETLERSQYVNIQ